MNENQENNAQNYFFRGPQSRLERKYLEEYLQSKGYTLESIRNLAREERRQLLIEACTYASLKLANIEAKAKFKEDIQTPI